MSKRHSSLFTFLMVALVSLWCLTAQAVDKKVKKGALLPSIKPQQTGKLVPIVLHSVRNDTSIPLRDMKPIARKPGPPQVIGEENEESPPFRHYPAALARDPLLQTIIPQPKIPGPSLTFEGGSDADNANVIGSTVVPPDTNGAVGPNNYFQIVNMVIRIFDKSGNLLLGPVAINSIWQGFGGNCQSSGSLGNGGDPIVKYDALADRWLVSQLPGAYDGTECVAISTSGDPTGTYFRYQMPNTGGNVNDYPKISVWSDAYYEAFRDFFTGFQQVAVAMERDKMLAGLPAQVVIFPIPQASGNGCTGSGPCYDSVEPSDMDGLTPPPVGEPAFFVLPNDDEFFQGNGGGTPDPTQDFYNIWQFHVDWTTPANSTFTGPVLVPSPEFDVNLLQVPQGSGGELLDALYIDHYRLVYRNFGDHEGLYIAYTVATGDGRDGVRWAEIRDPAGSPSLFQSGTFAPADGVYRWMPSLGVDVSGNIAIGYSASNSSMNPEIRWAGRLVTDPLGDLSQGEATMFAGGGVQTSSFNRWGDYSAMVTDPVDGCSFWYTSEYYATTGSFDFHTRVGTFNFGASCSSTAGTLNGTVTDANTSAPIAGATVQAGSASATTAADGTYTMFLAAATYSVTASKFAYLPQTVNNVVLTEGNTTTQNFALSPAPTSVVSGTVTDGSGHGYPLYARIDISGYPNGPVFTNPVTGQYSVTLPQGTAFGFSVNAVSTGYQTATRSVTPAGATQTEDFQLLVSGTCTAPGYHTQSGVDIINENFDAGTQPAGWTVVDNLGNGQVWLFVDPEGQPNQTGGSGLYASANSDFYGLSGEQDTELRTPVMDLSAASGVHLEEDTWYRSLGDNADTDVSTDGGSTWTNVAAWTSSVQGHETFDISAIAGGHANVMVRFHYYNAFFAWWWQMDNVHIFTTSCVTSPGGLVVGNVRDLNNGNGLNGAAVTNDADSTNTTTTFATPSDPNVDDGFYILFAPAGPQSFTATKSLYSPDTHGVSVVANTVTPRDFSLGSGLLAATPNPLEDTVNLGSTDTIPLHIANTGSGSGGFQLREGNGHTNTPNHNGKGAPVIRIQGRSLVHPKLPPAHAVEASRPNGPVGPASVVHLKETIEKGTAAKHAGQPKSDVPNVWTSGSPVPGGLVRYAHAQCAEQPDSFYVISGVDGSASTTANTWRYDAGTDTWNALAPFPSPQEGPQAVCYQGFIYVLGGGGTDQFFVYDIANDSWSTAATLPRLMWGAAVGTSDGKIYMVGGDTDFYFGGTSNEVDIYDIASDAWIGTGTPEPGPTVTPGYVQNGTFLYIVGGWNDSFPSNSNLTQRYDMSTDTWELGPTFTTAHSDLAVGGSQVALYAIGGDANGGGAFDATTTVERLDLSAWPGGSWTDAGDPLPSARTANNAGFCTTALAGGEVWSTGAFSGGITGLNDFKGTGEGCAGATIDVPWLSENPDSGTVAAGGSTDVAVTFDATVVNQPGDYLAHLSVSTNTPNSVPNVNVTMHVPVPPNWGTLNGTVSGLGRCDVGPGVALNKATVFIDTPGNDYTIQTDASGHYNWSFPVAESPATVTVSANGYILQTLPGVTITALGTTTSNFALRLDAPCGNKTPTSFDVTLDGGDSSTLPLTLNNTGAGALGFEIRETTFALPPLITKPFPARSPHTVPANGSFGPTSVRTLKSKGSQNATKIPTSSWFLGLPVPGGLVRYAHAQCDTQPNSFYVISGVDGTFSTTANAWRYDSTTNSWNALAPIPAASEGPTAACYQGKIYVMGGDGGTAMFIYDIAHNTWSAGADLPRGVATAAAGAWNGSVFLIGGDDDFTPSTGVSSEVDVYDIASDTWTGTGSSMPTGTSAPGYVQAGPNVYVVGGWGDTAPTVAVNVTQRYDMTSDTWTTGPTFTTARSDLAVTATDTALYAMGGDKDGGGFFDSSDTVERLDYTTWPAGAWALYGDPLPVAVTANNAGFCTQGILLGGSSSEIWSSGGVDLNFVSAGNNAFRGLTEHCYSIFSDVPWLSESPVSGSVNHDSNLPVNVTFDATGLAAGDYHAVLVVTTNDSGAPQFNIPVTLHVNACLFCDEFDDDTLDPTWTYKGTWSETSEKLTTTAGKKNTAVASPVFVGCQNCGIATEVSTSGGPNAKSWIYGWWVDKKNTLELQIREAANKVILKQRVAGSVIKKQSALVTINPNTQYHVTMTNNGATIVVNIEGTDVITFTPIGTVPSGTTGFAAKGSTVTFDYIHVN